MFSITIPPLNFKENCYKVWFNPFWKSTVLSTYFYDYYLETYFQKSFAHLYLNVNNLIRMYDKQYLIWDYVKELEQIYLKNNSCFEMRASYTKNLIYTRRRNVWDFRSYKLIIYLNKILLEIQRINHSDCVFPQFFKN